MIMVYEKVLLIYIFEVLYEENWGSGGRYLARLHDADGGASELSAYMKDYTLGVNILHAYIYHHT